MLFEVKVVLAKDPWGMSILYLKKRVVMGCNRIAAATYGYIQRSRYDESSGSILAKKRIPFFCSGERVCAIATA
jgi:hypothetical protein